MKAIFCIIYSLFIFNSMAATIQHKNCELFLKNKEFMDFCQAVSLDPEIVPALLYSKGYLDVKYYDEPTLNGIQPLSGLNTDDLLSGSFAIRVLSETKTQIDVKLWNNTKDSAGSVVNSVLIYDQVIKNQRSGSQSDLEFRDRNIADLINKIPDCLVTK